MTPRFARAVDPIFKSILDLLDQVHHGQHPSPRDQRLLIRGLLEHAEAILGTSREWELACYAITAWIDEMLVESGWQGADWWSNNVLEVELFNTRLCYEQFYVRAKEASSLPQRDALEVFYICMMLGFRGLYSDPQMSEPLIEAHNLPPDLEAWARQTALSIRLGQGRPNLAPAGRDLAGAAPLATRGFAVWSWVAALVFAITAAVYFLATYPGAPGA